ncbi:MAG: hypothetical protein ACKVOU_03660 [Cytophagales bacterium]
MITDKNFLTNDFALLQNPDSLTVVVSSFLAKSGLVVDQNKFVAPKFVAEIKAAVVGLTNVVLFNSQFPSSEHFIITAIRVLQGASATPQVAAYTPGIADGTVQAGLMNIVNNGVVNLKQMPLSVFNQGTNDPSAGFLCLDRPIVWAGQTDLAVNLTWAVAPTLALGCLSVQLWGVKLI